MAKVKGTAVGASVAFLKSKLGDAGFAGLVASLPEEAKEVFSRPTLQGGWYEFSALLALMRAAVGRVDLPPGRTLAWEMGRFSAEYSLNSVYRMFFKVADVGFICKRAASLYPSLYDSGEMRLVSSEPKSAILQVVGFAQPCQEFCDRALGWMERTLELTGAKGIRMSHTSCAARGAAYCEYRGVWQ